MKSLFLPLLLTSVFTNSVCTSNTWSQEAYPDFDGFQGSVGAGFGPTFYSIDAIALWNQNIENISVGAFSLGLSQVFGHSHWFYFQLRESYSYGYTFYGEQNTSGSYIRRLKRALFFDADARLFVPFRVAPTQRVSLQPFIGFAIHQAKLKGRLNALPATVTTTMLKQRYLSPLFGLALGYNPAPSFALRASLSVHMPNGKRALPDQSDPAIQNYHDLPIQRHGIGADLLALVKLTPNWTLTGELDYFTYTSYHGLVPPDYHDFFPSQCNFSFEREGRTLLSVLIIFL